jgi:hypothetical protein
MEYDKTCLVVWPEWGSSGIWHPHRRGEDGPVAMVSHNTIGLPVELSARFEKWIDWYDDYQPDYPDAFPWESFGQEGLALAFELARFVGDHYDVEYKNKPVNVFP